MSCSPAKDPNSYRLSSLIASGIGGSCMVSVQGGIVVQLSRMSWYLNRLRAMQFGELAVRVYRSIRGYRRIPPVNEDFAEPPDIIVPFNPLGFEHGSIVSDADGYCDGVYLFQGIACRERPIEWHTDPQSGVRAPMRHARSVDPYDTTVYGNVRNIWEKNRHHHLVKLAAAYSLTGERKYAQEVYTQLESWVHSNPYPLGVNWHSPLEAAIRLISWVWISRFLRGQEPTWHALFGKDGLLWRSIAEHEWFIRNHYSVGSSANNHLIGELAGLFISCLAWGRRRHSDAWGIWARKRLEREVHRQTFDGGLNREMAFSYHLFATEFFLLCAIEAAYRDRPFSDAYHARVSRMVRVIDLLEDEAGNVPWYGDSDEGAVLPFGTGRKGRVEWIRYLYAQLSALLREKGAADVLTTSEARSVNTTDAGLYVIRPKSHGKQMCLVADAGPLGFLSLAAHGHADALSFTLSVGGTPVIVDVGTYSYHYDPAGREYFRSTMAHNTVTVEHCSQSEPAGLFMWRRHASARVVEWVSTKWETRWKAEHDGYIRLPGRILHRRGICVRGSRIVIQDVIEGFGEHDLDWRLHFSPECHVQMMKPNLCVVSWNNGCLRIQLAPDWEWRLLRGQADGGWYSPSFNVRVPTYTLSGVKRCSLPYECTNVMEVR